MPRALAFLVCVAAGLPVARSQAQIVGPVAVAPRTVIRLTLAPPNAGWRTGRMIASDNERLIGDFDQTGVDTIPFARISRLEQRRGAGSRLGLFLGGTVLGTAVGLGAGALIANAATPHHNCGECGMDVAIGGAIGGLVGLVGGAVLGAHWAAGWQRVRGNGGRGEQGTGDVERDYVVRQSAFPVPRSSVKTFGRPDERVPE